MKRRIAISAGHSNVPGQDMGAIGNGYTEGKLTVDLRNEIVAEFKSRGEAISVDPDSNVTYQTVALFKQWFGTEDIVVDLHFNSSISPSATGTEVLIPAEFDSFEHNLATELATNISGSLGIINRGVKTELESARQKLLWMRIPAKNILIEVCFISNSEDMTRYNKYKRLVVLAIVNTLLKYKQI